MAISANRRREAYERDGHECRCCGREGNLTLHHITPRRDGGSHALSNLITLCKSCHKHWHYHETRHFDLSFERWLRHETRESMIWRAQVVKAIACGRLTGKSYPQIAEDMAEREILTKNNLRWQAGNLRRWTLKHVPELSEKRRWRLARWPYFAEEIVSEVWRWWKMTRPVAVYDGRGEVKTHHFYDFSQYTTRRRKSAPKNSTPAISQLALVKTERNLKGTKPIPLKLPEEWRGQDFTLALWRGDKLRLVRRDKHGKFYYQGHPAKFPSHFLKDDFTLWNHAEIDSIILQEIGVRRPSQTYRNSRCPFIISEVDVS